MIRRLLIYLLKFTLKGDAKTIVRNIPNAFRISRNTISHMGCQRSNNLAEVLGTILAGSMISVDGCNIKQPGTRDADTVPDSEFEVGKKYIRLCRNPVACRESQALA